MANARPMAVCGLNCETCGIYLMGHDLEAAEKHIGWFLENGWLPEGSTAQTLIDRGPWCLGCHGDREKHWSAECELMLCALEEKKVDDCAECDEFPCKMLTEWSQGNDSYAEAFRRLQAKHAALSG